MWLCAGEEEEEGSGELIRHTYVCVVRLRGGQKEEIVKKREEKRRETLFPLLLSVPELGPPSCRCKYFQVSNRIPPEAQGG